MFVIIISEVGLCDPLQIELVAPSLLPEFEQGDSLNGDALRFHDEHGESDDVRLGHASLQIFSKDEGMLKCVYRPWGVYRTWRSIP